jgi:hypothetical protein
VKAKRSARLVIDTDIAQAAGTSEALRSSRSREFLETTLLVCHRVVITPAIRVEWEEHQSRFFRGWLRTMTAKRKVEHLRAPEDQELRRRIEDAGFGPAQLRAARKDTHLLEAALAADRIVCSLEVIAPAQFRLVAKGYGPIRNVTWANPVEEATAVRDWLANGAPAVRKWQLRN